MSNIRIQRDHEGVLHLIVGVEKAIGSRINGTIRDENNELCFLAVIPLKHVTLGEVKNIIPFPVSG